MADKIHFSLHLSKGVGDRLNALAAGPGVTKSAIVEDAVAAWLNRRGVHELDERFGRRLDRISLALGRIERDGHILLETLALFVRYELAIHPPLSDGDDVGRAMARERFHAFVEQVGRQVAAGERAIDLRHAGPADEAAAS